ncbi:hypothetical protein K503DRAFT_772774 [Rhizopogon vinicolor AM-OR11-026]|uniref:Uncharacterized protein n=1 Tax=Rhizopogon vinicolor AM-OR11-026 TaxID=1314800 RepID=A0A1B7MUB4_9AGAM|nr:hypothetical protein K503DRAFT_772774 [Rhizopogon vinicolor AM-OR11-026]
MRQCFPWNPLCYTQGLKRSVEWGRVEELLKELVNGAKMRENQGQVLQECSLPD